MVRTTVFLYKEGCPVKLLLGELEIEQYIITLVGRNNISQRIAVSLYKNNKKRRKVLNRVEIKKEIKRLLVSVDKYVYQKSMDFLTNHVYEVSVYEKLLSKIDNKETGLFLAPFCNLELCEESITTKLPTYTIRCISNYIIKIGDSVCIFCGLAAKSMVYLG